MVGQSLDMERRRWIGFALLALLWHILLFMVPWKELLPEFHLPTPPPIEVKKFSQEELERIRNEWRQKKFLLSKDQKTSEEKTPPKNARFESDRNRTVDEESQARSQDVLPHPSRASRAAQKETQKRVDLRSLGIPYFAHKAPSEQTEKEAENSQENRTGADQSLLDKELPYSAENMLSTEQSIYYSFYARLYQAIAPLWQSKIREVPQSRNVPPGEYSANADAYFDEEGNLLGVNLANPSGIPEFDQAIFDSWKAVGRFPNPPRGLLNEKGEAHTGWTFTVVVDSSFRWQTGTPRRVY